MKKILLSFIVLGSCLLAKAQNEYLAAAESYFAKGDYYSASQYYEKYLSGKKPGNSGFSPYSATATSNRTVVAKTTAVNKETVIYNLAESYRHLNFHEKSVPNYKKVMEMNAAAHPLARYHYAAGLRAMSKYDAAENEFTAFLAEYKEQDIYAENAAREISNLKYIQQQLVKKDLDLYTINKAPSGINSVGGNYAPVWIGNSLFFTSSRPTDSTKKSSYTNRIYETDYSNGVAGTIKPVILAQPKGIHQGVATLTPDGNTMFLTRWVIANETKTSGIYISKKTNGLWSDPVAVDALNTADAHTQQPFIMPDGNHIIFSSDRAGGAGGFDLYYATLEQSGAVGSPVNMGPTINTKYDEQAPAYHAASGTLVFSSNGRTGMGGYDFFYTKGTIGNFEAPQNFGHPVNSIKDDIYFASRGADRNILSDVIISSDRDASCCLEMFTLNKKKNPKTIEGVVIACESQNPLADATITFADASGKIIAEKTTDASGNYTLSLDEYEQLKVTGALTGYTTNSLDIAVPADMEAEVLKSAPLCLKLITDSTVAIKLDNVYYDFNEAKVKAESYPSLNKLVTLLKQNPTLEIELGAHTDSKGTDEYNIDLSNRRAKSVVDYLVSQGISASRLTSKGYGESQPVADNEIGGEDNPEGRQQNRRTEFRVLKN